MLSMTKDKREWWDSIKAEIPSKPKPAFPLPESDAAYMQRLREENARRYALRVGMRVSKTYAGDATGTIVDLDESNWTALVLIDGQREPSSWWAGYWYEVRHSGDKSE